MKKIFITAGMLCAGFFFAQEGNIGINTNAPGATLDVNISPDITDATKGQGVAVPRVSKERLAQMTGDIVTSSLVYVDREKNGDTIFDDTDLTATVGPVNRVAKVDAVGFYYFDGSQWSKLGASGTSTSTGLTTPLILNKGAGTNGELIDEVTALAEGDWKDGNYLKVLSNGFSGTVNLPSPGGSNKNRMISVQNISGSSKNYGTNAPKNVGTLNTQRGHILISNGTNWFVTGGLGL